MTQPEREARLLPDDAYYGLEDAARDRVDARLRADQAMIPTETGTHYDREGAKWVLDDAGCWTDNTGRTRSADYAPIMSIFGPFSHTPSIYAPRSRRRKDRRGQPHAATPRSDPR